MAKGGGDVRDRLQTAALELFREHGYDRTTALEIATLAGVTERTFFRYFADKREILFQGEDVLRVELTRAVEGATTGLGAIDILFYAFRSALPILEKNRPFAEPRHKIISSTPVLSERELAKHAALADALAEALRARGIPDLSAVLAAQTGMSLFVHVVFSWLDDPGLILDDCLGLARSEMQRLWGNGDL